MREDPVTITPITLIHWKLPWVIDIKVDRNLVIFNLKPDQRVQLRDRARELADGLDNLLRWEKQEEWQDEVQERDEIWDKFEAPVTRYPTAREKEEL